MEKTCKANFYGITDTMKDVAMQFLSHKALIAPSSYVVFPGFCDVHVHFREPGFSYKETISSGSMAAAKGGYTSVCTMPNLSPVPDSVENLEKQLELIKENAKIKVIPYGAITVGEKGEIHSDMEGMAKDVIGFSDDGRGVQSDEMMEEAMLRAKKLGKIIAAHCEVNDLLFGTTENMQRNTDIKEYAPKANINRLKEIWNWLGKRDANITSATFLQRKVWSL